MWTLIFVAASALMWLIQATIITDASVSHPQWVEWGRQLAWGLSFVAGVRLLQSSMQEALRLKQGQFRLGSDLLRSVAGATLYAVAALVYLHAVMHLDLSNVLATSAVLSLIVGLALQATLGHFFSGVAIELERPFRVGDWVKRDELEGVITSLNWRSVHLLTDRGSTVVMPNSEFTSRALEVVNKGVAYRHQVPFAIDSLHAPGKITDIALRVLRSGLSGVCESPPPNVVLSGHDPATGTTRYLARYYTLQLSDRSTQSSAFLERLWYALARQGIALPDVGDAILAAFAPSNADGVSGASGEGQVAPWRVAMLARQAALRAGGEPVSATPEHGVPMSMTWQALLGKPQLRMFGSLETCTLPARVAYVAEGSLRELRPMPAPHAQAKLQALQARLQSPTPTDERLTCLEPKVYAQLRHDATMALGPLGLTLSDQVASLTDDAWLAYHAIGASIPWPQLRQRFLKAAPEHAYYSWPAGSWLGWPQALSVPSAQVAQLHTLQGCTLLVWPLEDVRQGLRGLDSDALERLSDDLRKHASGCESLQASHLHAFAHAHAASARSSINGPIAL